MLNNPAEITSKKNPVEKENVFLGGQSKWDQELLRFLGLGKKKS